MTENIYVVGFPKSGTTWLTRLLADVIGCGCAGINPLEDKTDPVSEWLDRDSPYFVRRGHCRAEHWPTGKLFTPLDGVMNAGAWDGQKVVLLVRDPRDIVVSAHYYFERPIDFELGRVSQRWPPVIDGWNKGTIPHCMVKYEDLVNFTLGITEEILSFLEIGVPIKRVKNAVFRQSFAQRQARDRAHADPAKRKSLLKYIRRGEPGNWREHFTDEQEKIAWKVFGETMTRLGYER